jgi:hypothetical protein
MSIRYTLHACRLLARQKQKSRANCNGFVILSKNLREMFKGMWEKIKS